jgi:hypothetical protein
MTAEETRLVVSDPNDLLWDSAGYAHAWRIAQVFAGSQLIPKHLQGKVGDCMIAILMAKRLNEDPLVVLQSIFVVHGRPGWAAQYVIARAKRSGIFRGGISWTVVRRPEPLAFERTITEWGENRGEKKKYKVAAQMPDMTVTATATLANTGEVVSYEVSSALAIAEGWADNTKYSTLCDLMLRYRSATLLVRLFGPEVMLGIPTIEEVEDLGEIESTPVRRGPPAFVPLAEPEPEPDPAETPSAPAPSRSALGALGLGPKPPTAARTGDAPGGLAAARPTTAQTVAAGLAAEDAAAARVAAGPVPADPKADAEAIAAFVGERIVATTEAKEALKAAMRLARLDAARWTNAVAYGVTHGLFVDRGGSLQRQIPDSLPPEPDDDALSGEDLRTEIADLERSVPDAVRRYNASFAMAGEAVVPRPEATDAQLRRYLSALLDAVGA